MDSFLLDLHKITYHRLGAADTVFDTAGFSYGFTGLEEDLEAENMGLCFPKQVHGKTVVEASAETNYHYPDSDRVEADAIFTIQKNQRIAVCTADCVPIIIADVQSQFVTVVHAGWKGLALGIIKEAVKKASFYVTDSAFIAFIGPCISQEHYEVDSDILSSFLHDDCLDPLSLGLCLQQNFEKGKWNLNLRLAAAICLIKQGIDPSKISILNSCTFKEDDKWYSYRRNPKVKGRNFTWVML